MEEKLNFINMVLEYYNYLLKRYNAANNYFDNLPEEKKDNIYESSAYKAYEDIISQLSQLEDMIRVYNLFRDIKEQLGWKA